MNRKVAVVKAWHDALNAGDADRLAALAHEEVEVGGPRGSGRGIALLRDWVDRAGVRLEPGRFFHRDDEVVVEQSAMWRAADTGHVSDPQTVASAFLVRDGLVHRVKRHPDLDAALEAVGLDESNEVRPPTP